VPFVRRHEKLPCRCVTQQLSLRDDIFVISFRAWARARHRDRDREAREIVCRTSVSKVACALGAAFATHFAGSRARCSSRPAPPTR